MITALRNALFCQSIKQQPDGRVDILGLRPDVWRYDALPTLETVDLFLSIDLDGKGATGFVRLDAPHFSHRIPFSTPPGETHSAMFFTLLIPIVESGRFTASVVDGANRLKPFKAAWTFNVLPNVSQQPEKTADLIRFCNEETAKLLASLHGRAPETHGGQRDDDRPYRPVGHDH